jgi:fatty-acid peroxygenase
MNLNRWATGIPRVRGWVHELRLAADPYRYLSVLMATRGSDAVQLRLLGEPTLCIAGSAAVAFFYDEQRIRRRDAAPEPLRATLFGKGGVQGLDDAAHRHRKALFLGLTSPPAVAALVDTTRDAWRDALQRWQHCDELDLYRALQPVLTRAVCAWAGVPLADAELAGRTRQLVSLFDDAASGLGGHLRSRLNRHAAEAWARGHIEAVRDGRLRPPEASALAAIARHRDERGRDLPARIAAVELLNLLRPVVAVSVYLVFVAHALAAHDGWADRLRARPAGPEGLHFVQEVRRHYPFFPVLAGRTRSEGNWRGHWLPAGMRVLLDLHGSNHGNGDWADPEVFRPERWQALPPAPPAFVPQGGGEAARGHRCPGEDIALQLMRLALEFYLVEMQFEPLEHRPPLDFGRLPAQPRGGFRLVRPGPRLQSAAALATPRAV